MRFRRIQEYHTYVRSRVAKCGWSTDWVAVESHDTDRKSGMILADPLRLKDGAILRFMEVVEIQDDGTILRPKYSYHYERTKDGTTFYFRYDRDRDMYRPVVHEECHLHVNGQEPRFKTHATSFDEVLDFVCSCLCTPSS